MHNPPKGFTLLPDDVEGSLIQAGDLLWHEGDAEWQQAVGKDIGDYVSGYYGVARSDSSSPNDEGDTLVAQGEQIAGQAEENV